MRIAGWREAALVCLAHGSRQQRRSKGARDERFRDIAQNRRARYEYEIVERFEAGLVLIGTEVKGLRERGATIGDAYVVIRNGEAWLVGATIPDYSNAGQ